MAVNKQKNEVNSTIKAFEVLKVITKADPHAGITLAELSKLIPTSKSTIHRYLSTLEQLQLIEKNDRDSYFLASGILQLAGHYLSNMNLPQIAEPFMKKLAASSQETVHLAVPSENEVVYVAIVDGPLSIRMMARIGTRAPMYCTALGKSILAHLPEEKLISVVGHGLISRTPNTITSLEALREEMSEIRAKGFSVDNIENEDGVRCIGAPLFDYAKKLAGAISISGPVYRVTSDRVPELGILVKSTALAISRRMGYPL